MTNDEAKQWLDAMSDDRKIQIVQEYHMLKEGVCARILLIPTGAPDWLNRAVVKAEHLRHCESQLRVMIAGISELAETATEQTRIRQCGNCLGSKTINGESCCICKGTGLKPY